MNTNRLINMGMRMLMRFAMQYMKQRNRTAPADQNEKSGTDRRQHRGKVPQGDTAKRMRALRKFSKF